MSLSSQTPPEKNASAGVGPMIGTGIILVLLVVGALYVWQAHVARIAAIRATNAAAAAAALH